MRTFRLYPEEKHWWSFNDYGAVLDVVTELNAKRILEFGPGSSTLSLIEGGATHVDTFESDPHWATVHESRLVPRYPEIIHLHRFSVDAKADPVAAVAKGQPYDLALIDGPIDPDTRVGILVHCVETWRCAAVLIPADASKEISKRIAALRRRKDLTVETRQTGPLAGSFTLIRKLAPDAP